MTQLFRKEVLEQRAERLHGDINLALPLGWQAIGYLLLVALVVALVFLFSARYGKVESVTGVLVPDKGVVSVFPSRGGVVTEVLVSEGQSVSKGDLLFRLQSPEALSDGSEAGNAIRQALDSQSKGLDEQGKAIIASASAETARLSAQIAGIKSELVSIEGQLNLQTQLVSSAREDLEKVKEVADRGFISRRDLLFREETYLSRQQQLAQLQQLRSAKMAALDEAKKAFQQVEAQSSAQNAGLNTSRSELTRVKVEAELVNQSAVLASASGIITAVVAKSGHPVEDRSPAMQIVPAQSKMRAELQVPASAIGFVATGQEVKLAIDSFPYQQFGTVVAKIEIVPVSPTTVGVSESGSPRVAYKVVASIPTQHVNAFGKMRNLLPGMTLTARIFTRRQTLIEWLFEPLFAVNRR